MKKTKPFEAPETISEAIYKYLKKAIIEGVLKPNQRVQEKEVAQLFGVSTTPAREAFQRLSAEKYLTIDARKEVHVVSATAKEIKEVFEVVRILDACATRKAVKKLSDEDIKDLREMTEALGELFKQQKIGPYVKQNLKIHFRIWEKCGNSFLYQTLVNLGEKFTFYSNQIFAIIDNPSFFKSSFGDHAELMKALEKRDAERAEQIISTHWGGEGFLTEEKADEKNQGT
jgi:DNA-binding GntR family transcriptional regulator